jgi:error-prone DNA polymerase
VQVLPLEALRACANDTSVMIAGLISSRQRPSTAHGVVFIALEDETGLANLIIWPDVWEAHRKILGHARFIRVSGLVQSSDGATSLLVQAVWPIMEWADLPVPSRDFR